MGTSCVSNLLGVLLIQKSLHFVLDYVVRIFWKTLEDMHSNTLKLEVSIVITYCVFCLFGKHYVLDVADVYKLI